MSSSKFKIYLAKHKKVTFLYTATNAAGDQGGAGEQGSLETVLEIPVPRSHFQRFLKSISTGFSFRRGKSLTPRSPYSSINMIEYLDLKVTLGYKLEYDDRLIESVKLSGSALDEFQKFCERKGRIPKYRLTLERIISNGKGYKDTTIVLETLDVNYNDPNNTGYQAFRESSHYSHHSFYRATVDRRNQHYRSPLPCYLTIVLLSVPIDTSGNEGSEVLDKLPQDVVDLLKKELLKMEMEASCDAIIEASNGAEIKCHKVYLSMHSSVLKTMLESSFLEGQTNRIKMTDMTEDGVKALLDYFYHSDISKAEANCEIAFELLRTADKYDVQPLVKLMKNVFLNKDDEWLTKDVAVDLFLLARNVESLGEEVKMKAVKYWKKSFSDRLEFQCKSIENQVPEPDALKEKSDLMSTDIASLQNKLSVDSCIEDLNMPSF